MRIRARMVAASAALAVAATLAFAAAAQTASKPPKQCAVARNRIVQQQKAIGDDDARIEREKRARFACGSQKVCRRHDRRIESLEERKSEHEEKMARLREIERRACTAT